MKKLGRATPTIVNAAFNPIQMWDGRKSTLEDQALGPIAADVGRFSQRQLPSMRGAFKTPTLRDIALTAPYMRNGIYLTLEEVVDHYDRGGDVKENLLRELKPLNLTAQEKADLVAFMKSFTGKPIHVAVPQLPQ